MIKDKIPQKKLSKEDSENGEITIPESVPKNPLDEIYKAVKKIILTIKEDEEDPKSPSLFKTVKIDNGQFERIIRSENLEMEIAFPAVFIHFTNVRYLVQQQRIGEGRATMRVRFILNTLNNQDEDKECYPFYVFQKINMAIQDAKDTEPALNERCNLTYYDMPTTTNMLQAYWIDYEVWFREDSAWKYRKWLKKYLVMPPFTNHDDAPERNENQHDSHTSPTYNEVTGIVMTDGSDPEPEEDQIYNSLLTEDENALMWSDGQYISLTDKVQE